MLAEADFQHVAQQISNLVGCDSVHLFLGCPVPELRHPVLNLFSSPNYCCAGYFGSSDDRDLLQHERVRALCDVALQTGQVQSIDQLHLFTGDSKVQSIAIAPFERPAGVLGIVLLTDHRIGTFYHGERQLFSILFWSKQISWRYSLVISWMYLVSMPGDSLYAVPRLM